jgi:hypothetical protein
VTTFPTQLQDRLAKTIATTKRLTDTAHQRLNSIGSQVAALQPGGWQPVTLTAGWVNLPGYVPAQIRIQQTGLALLVGHITGGTTTGGTVIGTLPAGYYNPVAQHAFTISILTGAATTPAAGTLTGASGQSGLPNGGLGGNSAYGQGGATTATHYHGGGTFSVINGQHTHTPGTLTPSVPVSYNSPALTVNPATGQLVLTNCPAAATQLSFTEQLPLVTS